MTSALAELAAERDYWRTYAKQLERALAPIPSPHLPQRVMNVLLPKQQLILSALAAHDACSKEALWLAAYGQSPNAPDPEGKSLTVHICTTRKAIRPFGLRIETIFGVGYRLSAESKAILNRMKNEEAARAV